MALLKWRCTMLVVVNQPHINNFIIQGVISDKDLDFLKKHFGNSMTVEDENDTVDYKDTKWFQEVESELTPASNLAFYRKLSNMTQKELADRLGTRKQVISDMEHNRRTISKTLAKELASIFDVSVDRFI